MITLIVSHKVKNSSWRAVFFPSEKPWDVFLMFNFDKELKNIPCKTAGPLVFMSVDSIPILEKRGLRFLVVEPINESDINKQQHLAVRRGKANLVRLERGGPVFFLDFSLLREDL